MQFLPAHLSNIASRPLAMCQSASLCVASEPLLDCQRTTLDLPANLSVIATEPLVSGQRACRGRLTHTIAPEARQVSDIWLADRDLGAVNKDFFLSKLPANLSECMNDEIRLVNARGWLAGTWLAREVRTGLSSQNEAFRGSAASQPLSFIDETPDARGALAKFEMAHPVLPELSMYVRPSLNVLLCPNRCTLATMVCSLGVDTPQKNRGRVA